MVWTLITVHVARFVWYAFRLRIKYDITQVRIHKTIISRDIQAAGGQEYEDVRSVCASPTFESVSVR